MKREKVIEVLVARGYEAFKTEVEVEGSMKKAIRLGLPDGTKWFTVVWKDWMQDIAGDTQEGLDAFIDTIVTMVNSVDTDKISDYDFILENCRVGMRKPTLKGMCRKSAYEGIEEYIYIPLDGGRALIPDRTFSKEQEEGIWINAFMHNTEDFRIRSPYEFILAELEAELEPPFYIVTNREHNYGAGAILARIPLLRFAREHRATKLLVIPSSIHEMLIAPFEPGMELDMFRALVEDVNRNDVKPEERLCDRAYVLDLNDWSVSA